MASHLSGPGNGTTSPPSSAAEDLAVLQSLFRDADGVTLAVVLEAQNGNLARAIRFLRGEEMQPVQLNQQQSQQQQQLQQKPTPATVAQLAPASQQWAAPPHPSAMPLYHSPQPLPPSPVPSIHTVCPDRRLSPAQKAFFFAHGFLHLSGVVAPPLVAAALFEINKGLGKGINKENYHKPREDPQAAHVRYSPEAAGHAAIAGLFSQSACPTLVESLMGPRSFAYPSAGQIALTFPTDPPPGGVAAAAAWWNRPEQRARQWHIDGIHRKSKGFAADEIRNFTMLVGVYLSAAPADFCGNIAVHPGSHRQLEEHFRKEDPLLRLVDDELPSVGHQFNPAHQLHVQPGDVLLAHYQTAHTVPPNYSPHVRYAIYFRLTHSSRRGQGQAAFSPVCMQHIWTEYLDRGMQDLRIEEEQRIRAGAAATAAAALQPPLMQQAQWPSPQSAQDREAADLARALELSRLDAERAATAPTKLR